MKNKIKIAALIAPFLVAIIGLVGWLTSTRSVEMIFKINDIPCSSCTLRVMAASDSEESFVMDRDGRVVLPNSFIGRIGICAIERGSERLIVFVEHGFDRGVTSVNFSDAGNRSTHVYRFLGFENKSTFEIERQDNGEQD